MTVYFVGMHNKPNTEPLYSKAFSGKLIDAICDLLETPSIAKTNLCDIDYFPKDSELIRLQGKEWINAFSPAKDDIIVLLGAWVHRHFPIKDVESKVLKVAHPASNRSNESKATYIKITSQKINELL